MNKREKIFFTAGLIFCMALSSVNAVTYIYASRDVSYSNNVSKLESTNVQDAIDELNTKAEDYYRLNSKIWPVGSVYISVTDDTVAKVEEKLGGTWVKLEGRFLLGSSSSYSAGTTGGSADAIVVSHNHTFTGSSVKTDSQGAHTHTVTTTAKNGVGGTSNPGNHTHGITAVPNGTAFVQNTVNGGNNYGYAWNGGTKVTATNGAGGHTHTLNIPALSGTAASNGAHQHNVTAAGTISTNGSDGTGKNMPPYLVVYMYKRTE